MKFHFMQFCILFHVVQLHEVLLNEFSFLTFLLRTLSFHEILPHAVFLPPAPESRSLAYFQSPFSVYHTIQDNAAGTDSPTSR